jgi:hypothetical protein
MCIRGLSDDSVQLATAAGAAHAFTFDRVWGTTGLQAQVFDEGARPIVDAVLQGYNGAVIAYGQTGSGKTHTMLGPGGEIGEDASEWGLCPRAVRAVFEHVAAQDEDVEFAIVVSFVEIYMERIRDLLDVSKDDLKLGELGANGAAVYVKDATGMAVMDEGEVFEVMRTGAKNRAVAATGMNQGSSRSHSILQISIVQENTRTKSKLSSKLMLVDLAGSEQVSKTGVSGQQLEELKRINKSLSALGNVINALTDGKSTHIPFRDSKLTRLMQDCLGGNAQTALVINCSPSTYNELETLSTLRFGKSAKRISCRAVLNFERGPGEWRALAEQLELRLAAAQRREAELAALVRDAAARGALGGGGAAGALATKALLAAADRIAGAVGGASSAPPAAAGSAQLAAVGTRPPIPPPATPARRSSGAAAAAAAAAPTPSVELLDGNWGSVGVGVGGGSGGSGGSSGSGGGALDCADAGVTDLSAEAARSAAAAAGAAAAAARERAEELERHNGSLVGLLREAGAELRTAKQAVDGRDARIAELADRLRRAESAAAAAAAHAAAANAFGTVVPPPAPGARGAGSGAGSAGGPVSASGSCSAADEEAARALRDNYGRALQQNEELRGDLLELRAQLAAALAAPAAPAAPAATVPTAAAAAAAVFARPPPAEDSSAAAAAAATAAAVASAAASAAALARAQEEIAALRQEAARRAEAVAGYEARVAALTRAAAAPAAAAAASPAASLAAAAAADAAAASHRLVAGAEAGASVVRIRGGRHSAGGAGAGAGAAASPPDASGGGAGGAGGTGGAGAESAGFFRTLLKRLSVSPSKAGPPPGAALRAGGRGDGGGNGGEDEEGGGGAGASEGSGAEDAAAAHAAAEAAERRAAALAAFFQACEEGDLGAVRAALSAGTARPSSTDKSGRTGLLYAGRGGQLEVVQFLVRAGCAVGSYDKDARNALVYAARRGHVEVVSSRAGPLPPQSTLCMCPARDSLALPNSFLFSPRAGILAAVAGRIAKLERRARPHAAAPGGAGTPHGRVRAAARGRRRPADARQQRQHAVPACKALWRRRPRGEPRAAALPAPPAWRVEPRGADCGRPRRLKPAAARARCAAKRAKEDFEGGGRRRPRLNTVPKALRSPRRAWSAPQPRPRVAPRARGSRAAPRPRLPRRSAPQACRSRPLRC